MPCLATIAGPHITTELHVLALTTTDQTVVQKNANRWGLIFPITNGSNSPHFFPKRAATNAAVYNFSSPQFQGGKNFVTFLDIGSVIEDDWHAILSSGTLSCDLIELFVPQDIKKKIAEMARVGAA